MKIALNNGLPTKIIVQYVEKMSINQLYENLV